MIQSIDISSESWFNDDFKCWEEFELKYLPLYNYSYSDIQFKRLSTLRGCFDLENNQPESINEREIQMEELVILIPSGEKGLNSLEFNIMIQKSLKKLFVVYLPDSLGFSFDFLPENELNSIKACCK